MQSMAMELKMQIVTPFGQIFDGEVASCSLPGVEGHFQVLPHHADLVSLLEIGPIKLQLKDNSEKWLASSGGYCEVRDNQLKVIIESAEFAEEIDIKRAQAALKRAEERLKSHDPNVDITRAKMAMARALNRIKIAQISQSLH
ncbi:F0F1 ATP synthase subunit epsilon [candidate division KSB1 bacterium]|nr:MAG: F0F1 ATP synthase subunit epsilon [candidate division KSB1 bacterium]